MKHYSPLIVLIFVIYRAKRTASLLLCAAVSLSATQWSRGDNAGSLVNPRYFHTATLLADGRVLLAGGLILAANGLFDDSASCEIYDPATNSWTPTGPLNQPRYRHSAVLLADGRVLVAGGRNLSGFSSTTAEIYDPATATWALTQPMLTPRETPFSPILLSDGSVLAAGGNGQDADKCQLFDPAIEKWSVTGTLNEGRWLFRATRLTDGRVLVAGGYPNGHTPGFVPDSEIYNPASHNWSLSGPLNRKRADHVQELLPDGRVLVAGGFAGHPSTPLVTNTTEIFDPTTARWTLARPMHTARGLFSGTLLNNGTVFVAGGASDLFTQNILNSIEEYDPATGRWHLLETTLATPRWYHTTITLLDGRVLISGGLGEDSKLLPDAEIFVNPR